ncbi:MAG: uroporphyrinogen-III C-methyltransferase [Verrucomicrobia bacterium]|nr:uroporphyrinogen-III C-methyltransferase [Verrucomicrobiota bacterium]
MKPKGIVYLVGAGPGDAGLLTRRGAELLGRAEVVVYDALVNPELLSLAPSAAELIFGGKRAEDRSCNTQEDINRLLLGQAREGKVVVRLKGGDPYIFGRGGEEAEALAEAGVPFEVVPGVTSAIAVPAYAGIPLTHRDYGSCFTVITGHRDPAKEHSPIDWSAVARTPGAKVILMGTKRLAEITGALIAGGLPPETPAAIVRRGTTENQQTVAGPLGSLAALAAQAGLTAPAVVVVGEIVKLRAKLNWFEQRPLFGQRVVVTRSRGQAGKLSEHLRERGAEVIEVPVIKQVEPANKGPLGDALLSLHEYDWLVFTSVNGVNAFFDYFFRMFQDLRDLGGVRLAAVGPATAARLRELHLMVDAIPAEALGRNVAKAMLEHGSIENLCVCLLRAEQASPELVQVLEERGAIVDDIPVYRTVADTDDPRGVAAGLVAAGADWLTFTSGSTVENFHARFNLAEFLKKFPAVRTASIGPETSKALATLQLEPSVEAREHTIPGLVKAIEKAMG